MLFTRWQAIEWREIGLSCADDAMHLNVSRVVRDTVIKLNRKIQYQENLL